MYNRNNDKIICITAAFNEEFYIDRLLRKLRKYCYKIVVVDDGSTDGTSKILTKYKNIHVLHNSKNIGKSDSIIKAAKFIKNKYVDIQYVLLIDSDLQHDPDEIPKFLNKIKLSCSDLIVGVRDLSSIDMPIPRQIWNRLISSLHTYILRIKITDSQSGYRMFKTKSFLKAALALKEKGYLLESEMNYQAKINNLSISEIRIKTIYQKYKLKNDYMLILIFRVFLIFVYMLKIVLTPIFAKWRLLTDDYL